MIRRETDAALINRVANDSEVRPFIDYRGVDAPMDWSEVVARCIVLSNGTDAVAAFEEVEPRIYQAHLMFLPTCRGKRAIETAIEMLEYLKPIADVVRGAGPDSNKRVQWFARHLGFASIGSDVYDADGSVQLFALRMH